MVETSGNLWHFHTQGRWVVVTTNGSVRKDGCAVMGRGVARDASEKFLKLPKLLGLALKTNGNQVYAWEEYRIFTFPVKRDWYESADLGLINDSAKMLVSLTEELGLLRVYMVRPGCGNGHLTWDAVKPILAPLLDDRFVVVERPHGNRM